MISLVLSDIFHPVCSAMHSGNARVRLSNASIQKLRVEVCACWFIWPNVNQFTCYRAACNPASSSFFPSHCLTRQSILNRLVFRYPFVLAAPARWWCLFLLETLACGILLHGHSVQWAGKSHTSFLFKKMSQCEFGAGERCWLESPGDEALWLSAQSTQLKQLLPPQLPGVP